MKAVTLIAVAALAAPLVLQPASCAAAQGEQSAQVAFEQPSQMVQSVADQILKALDGHRAELHQHPQQIRDIIEK